ncbi:MAG TPA: hypothetical protein VLT84_00900, partial [Acidobacteriota bacterium]|nr:hypothetical protein [Acidobacteriota bacterium]
RDCSAGPGRACNHHRQQRPPRNRHAARRRSHPDRWYFEKFLRYTKWSAADLRARGVKASGTRLLVRPVARFLRQYLLEGGFRYGRHGLVLCMLAAFSVFTKYARRWEDETRGGP